LFQLNQGKDAAMNRPRDNQRSRVYAWERSFLRSVGKRIDDAEFDTIEECDAWLKPIWRAERGRVGLAKQLRPSVERPHWGQQSALAHSDHRITLPRWARSRWVILHEAAHRLTPRDEAHGPRFVGVLMGLAARHLDYDANAMMLLADEMGVRYHVRSIGCVPVHGPAWHLERALREHGPGTPMELACHLSLACSVDITVRQVRGAALPLIRRGQVRFLRHKLVLLGGAS
jgi:hypothetical protein